MNPQILKKLLPVFLLFIFSCIPTPLFKNTVKNNIVKNEICGRFLIHDFPVEGDYSKIKITVFKGTDSSVLTTSIKEIKDGQIVIQQSMQYAEKNGFTENMLPGITEFMSGLEFEYMINQEGQVKSAFFIDNESGKRTELKINKDKYCNPTYYLNEHLSNKKDIDLSIFKNTIPAQMISYKGKNKIYHVAVLSKQVPFQLIYSLDLKEKNWKKFLNSKEPEKNKKYGINFMEITEYKLNGIIYKNN